MNNPNINRETKKEIVELILNWSENNLRSFPWRKDRTPYKVLLVEFLLKRTTATAVEGLYDDFVNEYPDIVALANADREELEKKLSDIGLQKQRSKGILEASSFIIDEFDGEIPSEREELLKIPHVGPYTADAVLSFGFGKPAGILDSNIKRIFSRLYSDERPHNNDGLKDLVDASVPDEAHDRFNLALLDLGALVCRYDSPRCQKCPLNPVCDYFEDEYSQLQN